MTIKGGSQGGGLALAIAALDPQVRLLVAINPTLCDHTGMVAGRFAGCELVPVDASGKPDPAVLEVSRCFDSVNFAAAGAGAGILSPGGLLDVTCTPSTVFATYNVLPEKKQMVDFPSNGHGIDGSLLWRAVAAVEEAHLAKRARKQPRVQRS